MIYPNQENNDLEYKFGHNQFTLVHNTQRYATMKGEVRQEIKGEETRGKYERKRKTYMNTGFKCEHNQSSDNN